MLKPHETVYVLNAPNGWPSSKLRRTVSKHHFWQSESDGKVSIVVTTKHDIGHLIEPEYKEQLNSQCYKYEWRCTTEAA